jgi:glycolate oxidase
MSSPATSRTRRSWAFYPPDPASLRQSVIGGNVAECAGGPRAFKYGTTKQYVLGLEAVLPTGEIVDTGGKVVKNVAGYDLTHLLVGSEGTLAIITKIILRLAEAAVAATSAGFQPSSGGGRVRDHPRACSGSHRAHRRVRSKPSRACRSIAGAGARQPFSLSGRRRSCIGRRRSDARRAAPARPGQPRSHRATRPSARSSGVRRELSPAQDGRRPEVQPRRGRARLGFALTLSSASPRNTACGSCFGHAGDGNIHVNIMLDPADTDEEARAHEAERRLFEGVLAMEGCISGEHGIGFAKAKYLGLELSAETIALMKRVKHAFDPNGILNPGKIFPD